MTEEPRYTVGTIKHDPQAAVFDEEGYPYCLVDVSDAGTTIEDALKQAQEIADALNAGGDPSEPSVTA